MSRWVGLNRACGWDGGINNGDDDCGVVRPSSFLFHGRANCQIEGQVSQTDISGVDYEGRIRDMLRQTDSVS